MGSLPKVDRLGEDGDLTRISAAEGAPGGGGRALDNSPNELWEWLRLLNRRKALIVGSGLVAVALRIGQTRKIQQAPGFRFPVRLQFEYLAEKTVPRLGIPLQDRDPC